MWQQFLVLYLSGHLAFSLAEQLERFFEKLANDTLVPSDQCQFRICQLILLQAVFHDQSYKKADL